MDKRLNDKGFSLIELVITVAIMVVLVGVLSATILKYMDRTKYGKDISALDSLNVAVQAYAADPEAEIPDSEEIVSLKTLIVGDGNVVYDPNNVIASVLGESFKIEKTGSTISACTFRAESKMFEDVNWEDILVKISNGAISIVAPINDGYNSAYVPYEAGSYKWTTDQKVKD